MDIIWFCYIDPHYWSNGSSIFPSHWSLFRMFLKELRPEVKLWKEKVNCWLRQLQTCCYWGLGNESILWIYYKKNLTSSILSFDKFLINILKYNVLCCCLIINFIVFRLSCWKLMTKFFSDLSHLKLNFIKLCQTYQWGWKVKPAFILEKCNNRWG